MENLFLSKVKVSVSGHLEYYHYQYHHLVNQKEIASKNQIAAIDF